MIDQLDLAFDENSPSGRPRGHRGSRRAGGRGGKGGGKTGVAFLMAFVLLAALGGGVYFGFNKVRGFFSAADYDGQGGAAVEVVVEENSTLTDIGNTLVDGDVVKSTKAFTNAAEDNPKAQGIQAGTYKMRKQMSAANAVTLMLDPKSRVSRGTTIQEGWTSTQVYAALSKSSGIPVAEFKEAAKDLAGLGIEDLWFARTDGQKVTKSIEGFLFPDTYEFPPKATAEQYLRTMVDHFMSVAAETDFLNKSKALDISPYEVLTVASLSQAEAGNRQDLGKVSRVAYNRLYGDESEVINEIGCRCLEYDVGINYYYQITGKPTKSSGKMTTEELRDPKNPYRLHGKAGLTPTPINNPSKAALEGALNAPKGNWLFFVAIDKQGNSAFTNKYSIHQKNIETAKKNKVL